MAARVFLLLVFTGLFAAAWNSDRPPPAAPTLASNTQRLLERPSVVDEVQRPMIVAQLSDAVAISSESDFSYCQLPEGIAAGTYRVIDKAGRVGWVSLPAGKFVSASPQDIYVNDSPQVRWYFIRVESASVIATPRAGKTILR
jgi:hypothetical protein